MADFVAVLRKTIDGLADNGPAMRDKVYEKARATVEAKLAALSPAPPASIADRQRQALEDAIAEVEAGYAPEPDPFAELENVFVTPAYKAAEPAQVMAGSQLSADVPPLPSDQVKQEPWADGAEETTVDAIEDDRPAVPFDGEDDTMGGDAGLEEETVRRRSFMPLIAAVVALALIAGGAYAVWLNKDDFLAMIGMGGATVATAPASDAAPAPATGDAPAAGDQAAPADGTPAAAQKPPADAAAADGAAAAGDAQAAPKFTQRLNSDGSEVDEGPAGGIASIGEGTSVAAVTQPPVAAVPEATPPAANAATAAPATPGGEPAVAATPAEPATAAAPGTEPAAPAGTATATETATATAATASESDAQVAVGQKAIFYEERTNVAEGSAEAGAVVWSLVKESPGNDLPPEPAIRGEATIPGKDVQLRMTIRRNADKTLPASHIIELIFLTPDNFEGGGIENILRFALKDTEAAAGSPVLGIPAKIADGFFLVALNDSKAEIDTNLGLLRRERWIDVPLVYKSGRRALITMEKGVPGDKVFDEAIKAWQTATASAG